MRKEIVLDDKTEDVEGLPVVVSRLTHRPGVVDDKNVRVLCDQDREGGRPSVGESERREERSDQD